MPTAGRRGLFCPSRRLRQDAIEALVLDYVRQKIFAPGMVQAIRAEILRLAKAKTGFVESIKALRSQIDALDQKIAKGTENLLLAAPEDMAEMSKFLREWREERTRLQNRVEAKAKSPDGSTPEALADRAVAELKRLQQHYKTGDPMKIRAVIKAIIEEIPVWWGDENGKTRVVRGLIVPITSRGVIGSIKGCAPCRFPRRPRSARW